MKHLSTIAVCALLLAGLLVPASALAAPSHAQRAGAVAPLIKDAAPGGQAAKAQFAPLARTLSGSATVLVHVYDYSGTAEQNALVLCLVATDSDYAFHTGTTDSTGLATISGLPAASGNGEIVVFPQSGDGAYDVAGLSWDEATGLETTVQPGRVTMQLTAGGSWDYWNAAVADIVSTSGTAQQLAETSIAKSGDTTSAEPEALPGTLGTSMVGFWYDEGAEVSLGGLTASAGSTTATAVNVDEASCQRIYNFGWASGKPGSATTVKFQDYPSGWVNDLYGVNEYSGVQKSFGTWTSPGGTGWVARSVTIPKSATPGFDYDVYADHTDGPLSLYEPFQVCSFTPSRATVSRTGTIRFSGRVPFDGDSTKKLLIYRRTTKAGQPAKAGGFSSSKGWTRVATCTAAANGKYLSKSLRPGRTSWYVLWYPSDTSNWAAWTSVAKVTVK